jgi:hypothetical protein
VPNFTMHFNPCRKLKNIENDYASHLSKEKNRNTDKANAFADDTTVATLASVDSLTSLKKILSDFAKFSGLNCNIEKTTITLVGEVGPPSQELKDIGFTFVDSFKLLGLHISNNIDERRLFFDEAYEKIRALRDFWDKLNLTLPGRISIAKTFMLSQIGYIGSIITPSEDQFKAMQKVMDDYCIGSIKIANNRKYLHPKMGGMGLINLKDYVTGIQCSWIKRLHCHCVDNWRFDMHQLSFGNVFALNSTFVSAIEHPILFDIVSSYEKFTTAHYGAGKNYLKMYIFKNPEVKRGRDDNGLLC